MNAKARLWFFVIFLAGSAVGFLVGAYTGGNFGISLIINSALQQDAGNVNTQLQVLRSIRGGNINHAIELLEANIDDSLVIFDPAEPLPGVKDDTIATVNNAIRNAYQYRREYPRKSDRPHVDTMLHNLFHQHGLTLE